MPCLPGLPDTALQYNHRYLPGSCFSEAIQRSWKADPEYLWALQSCRIVYLPQYIRKETRRKADWIWQTAGHFRSSACRSCQEILITFSDSLSWLFMRNGVSWLNHGNSASEIKKTPEHLQKPVSGAFFISGLVSIVETVQNNSS